MRVENIFAKLANLANLVHQMLATIVPKKALFLSMIDHRSVINHRSQNFEVKKDVRKARVKERRFYMCFSAPQKSKQTSLV